MSQTKRTTIKSHLTQDYVPVPVPIRSHESMMPIAEQQDIPLIIDVSNDEFNFIVSQQSDSKPEILESSDYNPRLNSFIDETIISLDDPSISNI